MYLQTNSKGKGGKFGRFPVNQAAKRRLSNTISFSCKCVPLLRANGNTDIIQYPF